MLKQIAVGLTLVAAAGLTFVGYIDHLVEKGFVPPNGRPWVDEIRKRGNEATHEIVTMTADQASNVVMFLQWLLKFVYEFPSMAPKS